MDKMFGLYLHKEEALILPIDQCMNNFSTGLPRFLKGHKRGVVKQGPSTCRAKRYNHWQPLNSL